MQDLLLLYNKTKKIYDKFYDIHLCRNNEIDDVLEFIDTYWQKGHILTKSRKLLDWQHYDSVNDRYNFVIARKKGTEEIHGIIGFISSDVYDSEIKTPIRWGAIWKVREDVAVKGLGVALKGYMEMVVPTEYIGGVGLSNDSQTIDTKLGERMGKLQQYYIANPDVRDYKIIENPSFPSKEQLAAESNQKFINIDEDEFAKRVRGIVDKIMPYKSVRYYINRYYRHPLYRYKFVGIVSENGVFQSVFVYRKTIANECANIFIVDYFGLQESLSGTYALFVELLRKENAECISFPCDGIAEKYMQEAGFIKRDDSDMILPVYYEPFARCNVELDFHFWSTQDKDIIIVKGDADQDRPNRLAEV